MSSCLEEIIDATDVSPLGGHQPAVGLQSNSSTVIQQEDSDPLLYYTAVLLFMKYSFEK